MKRVLVLLTSSLAIFSWSQVAQGSSCSCTAPDRSCSTSITCSNGCWSACSSGGSCSSGCGGSGGGDTDHQTYSSTTGQAEPFSWGANEINPAVDLSQRVSQHFKLPFAYVPNDSQEVLNVDFKELSLADLRHILARRGAVANADHDPAAKWDQADALATHYTARADNAQLAQIGEALNRVSSGAFSLTFKQPQSRMTVDIKGVTAADLARIFSRTDRLIKK
jgi:hypothetical protein